MSLYNLMNTDKVVLKLDLDDMYIEVIDNDFLPFELKDYVQTTTPTIEGLKKTLKDITVLKDFLISRTLNLSRENAKVILNVATLPQTIKTEDRLKIVFACNGLTMTDNFWLKKDEDLITFKDVNLRKNKLSNASYDIAILGKHISATRNELKPDLSTSGMFPKYWHRKNNTVYMYKTDNYTDNISVKAELQCSKYLDELGLYHVDYEKEVKDDYIFAVSKCIANDKEALIPASSIKDWCIHTNKDFTQFIKDNFLTDFANMCVCDYIFANTDRHFENWGFIIDNETNEIKHFAPLFDHNQALLNDYFDKGIEELIYEPLNKPFLTAAQEMYKHSSLDLSLLSNPTESVKTRIKNLIKEKSTDDIQL